MRIQKLIWLYLCTMALVLGCGKKDDSDDDGATEDKGEISNPSALLTSSLDTFKSAGKKVGSSVELELVANDESHFTLSDCSSHGEAQARDTDGEEFEDDTGRLRNSHPRYALQDFYCKMQKDTGAPDTFLGAIASNEMLFCFIGKGLEFDGKSHSKTLKAKDMKKCMSDLSEEEQQDILDELGESIKVKITASSPAKVGGDGWDASVVVGVGEDIGLTILLKDSDNMRAFAVNSGDSADIPVNAYLVSINSETGEAYFEAKFQRIRSANGSSSQGWNRHMLAYVKGKMNDDMKFTDVTSISGIYSDISINAGSTNGDSEDDPIQMGSVYTVDGKFDDGIVSYTFDLSCTGSSRYTCSDPNLIASWEPTDGSNACNGASSGSTCKGDGLEFDSNNDTAFVMHKDHDDYVKAETWIKKLDVPTKPKIGFNSLR